MIGVLLLAVAGLFSGCADFVTVQAKGAQVQQAAPKVAAGALTALDSAEPVVSALETATGNTLSDETITKGESVAAKTEQIASTIRTVGSVVSALPGPQQPFVGALTAVAAAIAGVAGGAGTFLARRREKKALRALDSALIAGVEADHYGQEVTKTAATMGTSDIIQARYVASGAASANDAYPVAN
jgi:hypothetical protein